MLKNLGDGIPFDSVKPVTSAKEILEAMEEISRVYVSDDVMDYIIKIADATRTEPGLKMGASPRATRALYRASKVWAKMDGRDFVTPDDVKALAHPVLDHRLISRSASVNAINAKDIIDGILDSTEASLSLDHVANDLNGTTEK